jgi:hypothetical protein
MNRDDADLRVAIKSDDRGEAERKFFLNPENGWSDVVDRSEMQIQNKNQPQTCGWGVEQLTTRLQILLEEQTYRYLPQIRNGVQTKVQQLDGQLDKLGFNGSSPRHAQKRFVSLCEDMVDITKHGMEGNWDRRFKLSNLQRERASSTWGT